MQEQERITKEEEEESVTNGNVNRVEFTSSTFIVLFIALTIQK